LCRRSRHAKERVTGEAIYPKQDHKQRDEALRAEASINTERPGSGQRLEPIAELRMINLAIGNACSTQWRG